VLLGNWEMMNLLLLICSFQLFHYMHLPICTFLAASSQDSNQTICATSSCPLKSLVFEYNFWMLECTILQGGGSKFKSNKSYFKHYRLSYIDIFSFTSSFGTWSCDLLDGNLPCPLANSGWTDFRILELPFIGQKGWQFVV